MFTSDLSVRYQTYRNLYLLRKQHRQKQRTFMAAVAAEARGRSDCSFASPGAPPKRARSRASIAPDETRRPRAFRTSRAAQI